VYQQQQLISFASLPNDSSAKTGRLLAVCVSTAAIDFLCLFYCFLFGNQLINHLCPKQGI